MPHTEQQNVAIFWDYENCHGPSSASGYEIVRNIRCIAHTFGVVKLFKAYFELSEQAMTPKAVSLRSELQSSGVSLTDCPHNGRKNVADQMIIVDMLAYAVDTPAPATIILISGDRDFSYATSVLRLRRYRVVVISLSVPGAHHSLRAQASVYLDWNNHVIGRVEACLNDNSLASRARLSSKPSTSNKTDINPDILLAPSLPYQLKFSTEPTVKHDPVTLSQSRSKHQPSQDLRAGMSTEVDQIAITHHNRRLSEDLYPQESKRLESMRILQMCTGEPSRHLPVLGSSLSGRVQCHGTLMATQPATLPRTPHYQEYSYAPQEGSFTSGPNQGMPNGRIPISTSVSNRQDVHTVVPLTSISLGTQQRPAVSPSTAASMKADTQVPPVPLSGNIHLRKPLPIHTLLDPYSMTVSSETPQSALPPAGSWSPRLSYWSPQTSIRALPPDPMPAVQCEVAKGVGSPTSSQGSSTLSDLTVVPPSADTAITSHGSAKQVEAAATYHLVNDAEPGVTTSIPKVVPSQFKLLVSKLHVHHSKGTDRPLRSIVAMEMMAVDRFVYQRAGTDTFAEYTALALRAGIIKLGGRAGEAWIALHPDWQGSVV